MARWKPGQTWHRPTTAVNGSKNAKVAGKGEKTRPVAATYTTQDTCPDDCALKGDECLAETSGMVPFTTRRLNSAAPMPAEDIAAIEASDIDALPADRKLRVHVVGDSSTIQAAGIVGSSMVRYDDRAREHTGQRHSAWTYTHAWRAVPASAWNGASVYASVHSPEEAVQARAQGYKSVAIVTGRHPSRRPYQISDLTVYPCPSQFKGSPVTCSNCALCMQPDKGVTVAFQRSALKKR